MGEWRKRSTVQPGDLVLVVVWAGIVVLLGVLILSDLGVI